MWSLAGLAYASHRVSASEFDTRHFEVVRVSQSVFAVRGKADTGIPTNSAIIVGDTGVAIVDAHQRPSLDAEMIGIVQRITDRPIRYLVNTHWHQDHTLGNLAFDGRATIIAHENTRADLLARVVPNLEYQRKVLPNELLQGKTVLEERKQAGASQGELQRRTLQIQLEEEYIAELERLRVVPPAIVFKDRYVLDIAKQPIELRHFGFGHTHGDIVVYLPEEKTIVLGDLVTAGQPFMRPKDAVPSHWAETLQKISSLGWNTGILGHGWTESARERLDVASNYLHTLVMVVRDAVSGGATIDDIVQIVEPKLSDFASHFPYFRESVGENILRTYEDIAGHENLADDPEL